MRFLFTTLLSIIFLSSSLFGQSEKPQTIIVPTGSLGDISEVRKKMLEKTLESKLDDYFDIVPKDLFEEAQEQAFQEMESDECTEEQCIMMIREILQVENSFQLVLMVEEGDTQISLTWNDLDKKRVEEEFCEGCKTKELRESIEGLVEKFASIMKENSNKQRKDETSYQYDGTSCIFRLLRPMQGYPNNPVTEQIAEGNLLIRENRIELNGDWLTGGDATPESFKNAKIYIKEDGRLAGVMEVYHNFTSWFERSKKPILVDFEETTGKFIIGSRKASFKFPMNNMTGKLEFLSCSK